MNNISVENLRKNGYKVRVKHYRIVASELTPFPKLGYRRKNEIQDTDILFPYGGYTEVDVRTPEGVELHGKAECSVEDNFCYKLGTKIALSRALQPKQS